MPFGRSSCDFLVALKDKMFFSFFSFDSADLLILKKKRMACRWIHSNGCSNKVAGSRTCPGSSVSEPHLSPRLPYHLPPPAPGHCRCFFAKATTALLHVWDDGGQTRGETTSAGCCLRLSSCRWEKKQSRRSPSDTSITGPLWLRLPGSACILLVFGLAASWRDIKRIAPLIFFCVCVLVFLSPSPHLVKFSERSTSRGSSLFGAVSIVPLKQ